MRPPLPGNASNSLMQGVKATLISSGIGLLLLLIFIVVLWKNEGRAIRTARGLAEGVSIVVPVDAAKVDAQNDSKLVHLSGNAVTKAPLEDLAFGIKQPALRLMRKVQMYQWKEKSETSYQSNESGRNGTTVYTYDKVWDETPINSTSFNQPLNHTNPTTWRFSGESWTAKDAAIGAFHLPEGLVVKLGEGLALPVGENSYTFTEPNPPQLQDGGLYFGANPQMPQIGDLKVTWQILKPGPYSIVGRQSGTSITPYPTKAGTFIELVASGHVAAHAMFDRAVKENIAFTWAIRLVGTIFVFVGIRLLFNPLASLGRAVPFISRLLSTGVTLFSAVLAVMLSLLVIGTAWFAYRPLLTIALLFIIAVIGIGWGMKYRKTAVG
ncbi:uncharacterized protein DUF1625 [Roseimicrobium gellanilyticum]|uniref:Uncharacterized protein DUF1625 n=1 Tax=Roseimicrobium gellanilyticum TaxID=748857 RepID=A0A366HX87_9BACT|nr:TMEM43 family protein [Roseimicrobium gellanilyticum]RBP47928.1 uncharacterized protein DUF1625 [Roseimicrobium gellanilyticum]